MCEFHDNILLGKFYMYYQSLNQRMSPGQLYTPTIMIVFHGKNESYPPYLEDKVSGVKYIIFVSLWNSFYDFRPEEFS